MIKHTPTPTELALLSHKHTIEKLEAENKALRVEHYELIAAHLALQKIAREAAREIGIFMAASK